MPKSILSKALCTGALLLHAGAMAAAGATFISQSVPNAIQLGTTYTVSVTYKNTGTTKWTSGQFRLGTQNPHDTRRWGGERVDLPPGTEVAPNALYTFTFDVAVTDARFCHAMSNPQLTGCNFQWGLVQEHVTWLSPGVNTEVLLFDAPAVRSPAPPVLPPVPVEALDFSAANFRGANMLMQTYEDNRLCDHTAWLPEGNDVAVIIDNAVAMGLNVLRIPVILPPKSPGAPSDWIPNSPSYASVCADPAKKEWGQASNGAEITQGIIAKMKIIMDKADAAHLKVIPILDGYTKYDATCYWKKSFLDVRDSADAFIKAFKSHPALLAWDIMNEPMWNALAFDCLHSNADYASVVHAVDAMYNLVRSNDAEHPTTVGEHQIPLLKYWKNISSFASPHLYIYASSRDHATRDQINYVQGASIREMGRELGAAMPLIIGEFGSTDGDDDFNESYYERYLNGLTVADRGFMLWSLSTGPNQQGYSVMTPEGGLKPAAQLVQRRQWYPVIQQLYLSYLGYPADPGALDNFSARLSDLATDMRARSLSLRPNIVSLSEAYHTEPALRQLFDGLYASSEFRAIYTPDRVPEYVQQIYTRLFNREADVEGLKYWVDNINYYGLEKSNAILAIYAGSLGHGGGGSVQGLTDALTGRKKAAVASAFSASLNTPARRNCYSGNNAVTTGRVLLSAVHSSTDVAAYRASIDQALAGLCGL